MRRRYSSDLGDRALYRRDCRLAAQGGSRVLARFFDWNQYLFAQGEVSRVRAAALSWGWSNLAYYTDQQFRAYRGQPSDPRLGECLIVMVLITPHAFIRHVL